MGRTFVLLGVVLVVVGLLWPWIGKLGLGRLPGDFYVQRGGWSFYFPLTTGLVVSAVVSFLIWFLRR